MSKPHLSASGLGMLSRCGVQFYERYIEGNKTPPSPNMATGTATHKGAEVDMTEKFTSGDLLDEAAVLAATSDEFDRSAKDAKDNYDGFAYTDTDREKGTDKVLGEAKDKAVMLASLYHKEYAPVLEPTQRIEWKWNLETEFSHNLRGVTDLETTDGAIHDLKTSGRSPAASTAATSDQLTMYAMAKEAHDGAKPTAVVLDYLVATKTPKAVRLESTRTDDQIDTLLRRFERATAVIDAGNFMPAPEGSWYCAKNFCGYWTTCVFARR